MSSLILHHYAVSPFSEKIRKMLGHAGMEWQSVKIRPMPPRPHLESLTGGYRKVPVAQIGADIFCDSKIIAAEIAALSNKPELELDYCDAEVRDFARFADSDIFFAALLAGGTMNLLGRLLKDLSVGGFVSFMADRIGFLGKATVRKLTAKEARELLHQHLADLESRLKEQAFLFGETPNHADFSAYHSLWISREIAKAKHFDGYPGVREWMDRIAELGEGQRVEISADQALDAARSAEPRPVGEAQRSGDLIGNSVSISPTDYARDQTRGVLVGESETRWIISRQVDGLGKIHVHFPRSGYELASA